MTRTLEPVDPLTLFLRACARIDVDEEARTRLVAAAESVREWRMLAVWAEDHGLSPLVRRHVRRCGVQLPDAVSRQLNAMAVRHRDASRVQTATLLEIVDALDAAGIEHVVLKGAFLAYDIYPDPGLRPLRDLDILVAPGDGPGAQRLLRKLGFDAPLDGPHQGSHHHLPAATRPQEGYTVSVEVHEDALSHDQPGSLTLHTMSQPPRKTMVGTHRLLAFGHVDMLRHLGAHLLQPRMQTRLLGVADLVEYAARYAHEIDWDVMRRADPRTVNALSMMDYVTPLPAVLEPLRPAAEARPPTGFGRGFPPLSTVSFRGGRVKQPLTDLLYPSEWWMRAYYSIPPGRSLMAVRWGRHLWRLTYWGLRRLTGRHAIINLL